MPSLSRAVNGQWASLKHFKHGSSCRRAAEEDAASQPALQPLLHGSPHPLLRPRLPALRQLRQPADRFEYARLHTHSSSSADIPQSPGDFIFGELISEIDRMLKVLHPFLVILVMMGLLQFSGQGAITFYTAQIFKVRTSKVQLSFYTSTCKL